MKVAMIHPEVRIVMVEVAGMIVVVVVCVCVCVQVVYSVCVWWWWWCVCVCVCVICMNRAMCVNDRVGLKWLC